MIIRISKCEEALNFLSNSKLGGIKEIMKLGTFDKGIAANILHQKTEHSCMLQHLNYSKHRPDIRKFSR